MERHIYYRDDIINIMRTAVEAGRALARKEPDTQYVRGYATALGLILTAFGLVKSGMATDSSVAWLLEQSSAELQHERDTP